MSLPAQTFDGITQEIFNTLASKLKAAYGLQLDNQSGVVNHSGFELSYVYYPNMQRLILQCLKKPFIIPQSAVLNGIADYVVEAKSESVIRKSETQDLPPAA